MGELSRRAFLGGIAAAVVGCSSGRNPQSTPPPDGTAPAGATTTATTTSGPPDLPADVAAVAIATDPFTLGVASGDPDETSIVLWTRLAPDPFVAGAGVPAEATEVVVELAPDPSFTADVRAERHPVDVDRGHAVHALVEGLDPGTEYRYRFRIGSWTSAVGTTRTAPVQADEVRLAVASCQRYDHGFFAAHRSIATAELDLVVFVGDYIYEAPTAADATRPLPGPLGGAAATDLDGYRHRYAAARLDPDLAAAHAAHPWAVTWDDHEVVNDDAGGGSGPGTAEPARRAAAYQAWWEHQPVRLPPPAAEGAPFTVHRAVRWGGLLDLLLLDTRQHRSTELCGGSVVEVACAAGDDDRRTMLGTEQEAWLAEELADGGATWTAIAQSVVVARVEALGLVNADAWDGYPVARSRLVAALAAAEVRNPLVLSGDVHVALVTDVTDASGAVVATELVAPSISSRANDRFADAVDLLPVVAPDVVFGANHRGWLRCEITTDACRATFLEVDDPTASDSEVGEGRSFVVDAGSPGARPT